MSKNQTRQKETQKRLSHPAFPQMKDDKPWWPAKAHTAEWATPEQMAVIEDAMRRKKR